jgi:hypothetical protein
MKTPEEIKKALDCCSKEGCAECQYKDAPDYDECTVMMAADALAYIRCLEAERDALLDALRMMDVDCTYCKHAEPYGEFCEICDQNGCYCPACQVADKCPCRTCTRDDCHWEWCGVCEENGGTQ